jgi:thiol:disulfide interchange protein DsbA
LLTSIFISGDVKAETRQLVEGEDYKVMAPKGTKTPQVLEFFNYACGACYSMESFVTKFKQENTEIKVTPVPMDLGHQQWTIYVKAFYMGELLKVLDKSHAKMFHRINIEKKQITSEEGLKTFFIELGVDSVSYDKADKSFALSSKLRKAKQLARKYQVSGTPTFVANRRFRLDNSRLESTEMIEKALKDLTTITL